ncbi:hypothetical protein GOODEAATRI_004804 [Goodea atripinnis]|uniref:Uncharacterized protein n=1 Tax=Goodea atripinnis TaxID=208336 RepID=A0ABV0P1G3_9TELE
MVVPLLHLEHMAKHLHFCVTRPLDICPKIKILSLSTFSNYVAFIEMASSSQWPFSPRLFRTCFSVDTDTFLPVPFAFVLGLMSTICIKTCTVQWLNMPTINPIRVMKSGQYVAT